MTGGVEDLKRLIQSVGKNLGRSEEDMKGVVKTIIDDNWINSIEVLRSLSADQWRELPLPLLLKENLKERVGWEEREGGRGRTHKRREREEEKREADDNGRENREKDEEDLTEVCYLPPSQVAVPYNLSVHSLTAEINDKEELHACIRVLLKLIHAILANPKDPAKRRIRIMNDNFNKRVGKYPSAVDILHALGFVAVAEYLELPTAFISRLTDCHHLLCQVLTDSGEKAPTMPLGGGFNPYQSNISVADPNNVLLKDGPVKALYDRRLEEASGVLREIGETERMLKTGGVKGKIPLNPLIYHLSTGDDPSRSREEEDRPDLHLNKNDLGRGMAKGLRSGANKSNNNNYNNTTTNNNKTNPPSCPSKHSTNNTLFSALSDESSSDSDEESNIQNIKELINLEGPKFKSRAKGRLEQLRKQKVFSKCTLRIQFPDHYILQLEFAPSTRMLEVNETIKDFLPSSLANNSDWYIYTTPPFKVFTPSKTLYEESLLPASKVYFKPPPDYMDNCLLPEMIQMYKKCF